MASSKPSPAKVEDYPERPYEDAKDPKADEPRVQVDQIADYHEKYPTLKADDDAHDPAVQQEVQATVVEQTPEPQGKDAKKKD